MNNVFTLAGAIVISGAMISGAVLYSNNDNCEEETVKTPEVAENKGNEKVDARNIDIEDWPTKGDPDAPVVIIEYSDYACPFSKRLKEDTVSKLKEVYVESGRVLFVYKDLPVVGGNLAAEAAHCAGEQGAYWEYHDILFENQTADRGSWGNPDIHRGYAETLGLDANRLVACFQERRYREKVLESTQEAQSLGGRGTPFLLINTQTVSGAQPYPVFEQIIQQELN